jgi:hypothetical protein
MKTKHIALVGLAAAALIATNSLALAGRVEPHTAAGAPLVDEVRRATGRFQDMAAAQAAGYALFHGCVSGPQGGAMGVHFVNGDLVGDGKLDATKPEALMYEMRGGRMQLAGVEYVVFAEAWDAANKTPPMLRGQLFTYNASPNRYGIPAHYALHVWAWKPNPSGTFADWNPRVLCDEYVGEDTVPSGASHGSSH